MNRKHSQTAILLFAQTAKVDTTRKSLVNKSVMNVLNTKILKTVRSSGLDYYHFTEKEQHGNSFGTRFKNSVQDVFEMGYQSVICLGNDTPLLTVDLIHQAAQSLQTGIAVKGKSIDGGLYLIGLNKEQFDPTSFEYLPWQSKNLANSFHTYLGEMGSAVVVLKSLHDIDSTNDLFDFLAGKDTRLDVIKLLNKTLLNRYATYHIFLSKYSQVAISKPANKGSPWTIAA